MKRTHLLSLPLSSLIPALFVVAFSAPALGQPVAAAPKGAEKPADSPAAAPAPATPAPQNQSESAPKTPAGQDALAEALRAQPGGLTPEDAGKLAVKTRPSVQLKQAELRAAAAKVDQALIGYFPRLVIQASYTRQSKVENSLGSGLPIIVPMQKDAKPVDGPLVAGPCPPTLPIGPSCVLNSAGVPVGTAAINFDFPVLLNSYSFVGSLGLPISDWVLRMSKGLSAAGKGERASKLQVMAEQLQVAADAKITFLNWVRVKGQLVVAKQAVSQVNAHVVDAKRVFEVGLISRGDVLRLEAQAAATEQVVAEAEAFALLVEQQLRQAIGYTSDKTLAIGIDVMSQSAELPHESLEVLQKQAEERRLEVRAIEEALGATKDAEDVTSAGYLPRVELFANGMFANPNPRIFPAKQEWNFTWDAGVRMTWVVNESFITSPAVDEAKARTSVVATQRTLLRDGLMLEVASAYADIKKSVSSIEAAERGLVAAEETLRVRSELFKSGKATSTDLIDAETEVTRARLRKLDAHVGLLIARTRLLHATGRDVPANLEAELSSKK